MSQRWEYCLLTCTPVTGLAEGEIRITGQVVTPAGSQVLDLVVRGTVPLAAIGRVLNELGQDGWEMVAYDTSTNRGVFKRPVREEP